MGCSGSRNIPKDDEFEVQRIIAKKTLDEFNLILNKKLDLAANKLDASKLKELDEKLEGIRNFNDKFEQELKILKDIFTRQKEKKDKLVQNKEKIIQELHDDSVNHKKKFTENLLKQLESLGFDIKDMGLEQLLIL